MFESIDLKPGAILEGENAFQDLVSILNHKTVNIEDPTKEDIKTYLEIFAKLSDFEANHRLLRKWGVFTTEDLQKICPSIERVRIWLERQLLEEGGVNV